MITSFEYKNETIDPAKGTNMIAGGNGSGKSVMLTGIYQYLTNGTSDLIRDVSLMKPYNEYRVYYIKQDDLITNRLHIEAIIKEQTMYNFIKENIKSSLKNIEINDADENSYKLKVINTKVQNNIENFKAHKKLLTEKEKIENYMRSKESKKLCTKIIELQDKIASEEILSDNFENNISLIKKEKLEKEIFDLKAQLSNEHDLIERKKILWREESKIKESIKKYRNDRRVIDLIEFDKGITDALIAVLGNRLKAKVVQYEGEALNEIENLKFRQTYLVLDKLPNVEDSKQEIQKEGFIAMKKLIKTKEEFNRLKEFLFKDIYIVENIVSSQNELSESDYFARNKILVTLTGQVLHKNGAITGGFEENKDLKYMINEKETYRKGIERLKEIEDQLKKVADSSISSTKNLINKIIAEKENEIKNTTISKNNINYNLEKMKICLNRLIEQKKDLNISDDFQLDPSFEKKNLYEELGRINKELRSIMINKKIDYEDIANRIDELVKKDVDLEKQKLKMQKIAQELLDENDETLKVNMKQICERITHFYNKIGVFDFTADSPICSESETKENFKNSQAKSQNGDFFSSPFDSNPDLKEAFKNIQLKSQSAESDIFSLDESNELIKNIRNLSGGQLQILTLSLMFAINEIAPFDVILLDEIDSNLDESKMANLQSLITETKAQIFQISHKKNLRNYQKCFWITKEKIEQISNEELYAKLI
ncbi:Structural maintenance of chromosome [Pseudoloma neurophilia]|uniref:Structural maintenance of chromosome n=1 Tax=Pseudoloma neurophilia TaxID=146866 RepID=A0A0R0M8M6_9MICR|nr:Structural maintenance of chromosome [Pseudoloma neurophilia]